MTDLDDPQLSKSYSIQTLFIGSVVLQDMKLGHYMKISPRTTFTGKADEQTHSRWTQLNDDS